MGDSPSAEPRRERTGTERSRLNERKKITAKIYARFEPEPEVKAWSNPDAMANVFSVSSLYGVPPKD